MSDKMFIWLDQTCHRVDEHKHYFGNLHVYPNGEGEPRSICSMVRLPDSNGFKKIGTAREAVLRSIEALGSQVELFASVDPAASARYAKYRHQLRLILERAEPVSYRETFTDYVVEADAGDDEYGVADERQSMSPRGVVGDASKR